MYYLSDTCPSVPLVPGSGEIIERDRIIRLVIISQSGTGKEALACTTMDNIYTEGHLCLQTKCSVVVY